jgi:hypothetical protein
MKQKRKIDDVATLLGGEEIEAIRLDGKTERVKVRQLAVELYPKFLVAVGDEIAMIALYCDRDAEWVRSLTTESFNAIADKGRDLNLPFFRSWLKRGLEWTEALRPGSIEKLNRKVDEDMAAAASRSLASSPTSPSAPA